MEATSEQQQQPQRLKRKMSTKEEECCDDNVNINNDNNDDCNDDSGGDTAEWNKLQRQLLRLSSSMEAAASKESSPKPKNDNCNFKKLKPSIDIEKPVDVAAAAAAATSPSEKAQQRNSNTVTSRKINDDYDLRRLAILQIQMKEAIADIDKFRQSKVDEVEESNSPLIALGVDILSTIMRYLDEDALIQCELASSVLNSISNGKNKDHWKYLHEHRREFWSPPRDGEIVLACEFTPLWFNCGKKLNLLCPNDDDDGDTKRKRKQIGYFGIMAAKARKHEKHGWMCRRPGRQDSNDGDACEAACEDYDMPHSTFSRRIRAHPRAFFLCLSHRYPEKEQRTRTQGWVDYKIYNDGSSNGALYLEILNVSDRICKSQWPEIHRIWNTMDPHDNTFPSKELRGQVEALAGNLRVTILNARGELIATTGGFDECIFRASFVQINLHPMEPNNDQTHEQHSSGGGNVSICIFNDGDMQIRSFLQR